MSSEHRSQAVSHLPDYLQKRILLLIEWGLIDADCDTSALTERTAGAMVDKVQRRSREIMNLFPPGILVRFGESVAVYELSHHVIDSHGKYNTTYFLSPDGRKTHKTFGSFFEMSIVERESETVLRLRDTMDDIKASVATVIGKLHERAPDQNINWMRLRLETAVFRLFRDHSARRNENILRDRIYAEARRIYGICFPNFE